MKKTILMTVLLCTLLSVCVNPVWASRHRNKTYPLYLQRQQMLKSLFVIPYEVYGNGDVLTFRYTAEGTSEVRILITNLSGKEITSVVTVLTNTPFSIDLPKDCPECLIRIYDKENIYEATY